MQKTEAVLRAKEVARKTGLSLSAVWYKTNPKHRLYDPAFPQPFKVSANATGWLESEVNDYIKQLADSRQTAASASYWPTTCKPTACIHPTP